MFHRWGNDSVEGMRRGTCERRRRCCPLAFSVQDRKTLSEMSVFVCFVIPSVGNLLRDDKLFFNEDVLIIFTIESTIESTFNKRNKFLLTHPFWLNGDIDLTGRVANVN